MLRGHGSDAARKSNRLRCTEVAFAVAGENQQALSAARSYYQVLMSANRKAAQGHEIRPHRDIEDLRVGQEGRGKLAAANRLKCRVTLRSKSINVAAM